ncbi:Replication factor A protein 2 [Savitreella phatthalungensis]
MSFSYDQGGYAQNNYGSNGGYSAGGFVQGGGSQGGGGGGGVERKHSSNTLRPVTLGMIVDATQQNPDSDFRIDEVDVGSLTVVAKVVSLSAASTNTTFKLEDGTGTMEAKQWVDPSKENALAAITQDSYVRVYGTLKAFNGRRHISITTIRLADEDEVAFHAAETEAVRLFHTRGPPGAGGAGANGGAGGYADGGAVGGGGGGGDEMSNKLASLDPFSRRIMEAIHSLPDSNEGVNVRQLSSMLGGGGGGAGGQTLVDVLESLKEEGHLYTTIDEDHVKSTMLG